jgi:nucleotide-binding universal stress UspA family protein
MPVFRHPAKNLNPRRGSKMQNTLTLQPSPALSVSEGVIDFANQLAPFEPLPFLAVRSILLPFDLSRSGVCTLRAVSDYAEKVGATIHLLHIVPPAATGDGEPAYNRGDDHVAEASERLLKQWVKRMVRGRVQTFVSIRMGELVDVIVARAVATRADLIVMTSRSCSGLKNELQRSAAERVSRLAPCPVLTIPEKCADEIAYTQNVFTGSNWRTVLLPVDFSTAAEFALGFAAKIASETGASLVLAHGVDADDLEEPMVHERLRLWAKRFLIDPISTQTVVWPGGHSLYAILSEAVRAEASLIVLPTRVQPWARRLRAGSITDGVLRQATCPVLSINENIFEAEN